MSNVNIGSAAFLCRIQGEKEKPVRDVSLRGVKVASVTGPAVVTENVEGMVNQI